MIDMCEECGMPLPTPEQFEAIQRAKFEAWISAFPYEKDVERIPNDATKYAWPGTYRHIEVQLAWEAWQEAAWEAWQEARK